MHHLAIVVSDLDHGLVADSSRAILELRHNARGRCGKLSGNSIAARATLGSRGGSTCLCGSGGSDAASCKTGEIVQLISSRRTYEVGFGTATVLRAIPLVDFGAVLKDELLESRAQRHQGLVPLDVFGDFSPENLVAIEWDLVEEFGDGVDKGLGVGEGGVLQQLESVADAVDVVDGRLAVALHGFNVLEGLLLKNKQELRVSRLGELSHRVKSRSLHEHELEESFCNIRHVIVANCCSLALQSVDLWGHQGRKSLGKGTPSYTSCSLSLDCCTTGKSLLAGYSGLESLDKGL